ncbi:DNA (cytosine-5)-methyltransferase 3-like isoform X1 [Canis aureus]
MCICCGSLQVHTQHPLFEGGMCAPCKVSGEVRGALQGAWGRAGASLAPPLSEDKFLDCLFLYDDDGYQSYCSICCSRDKLLICENPDCTRAKLCGSLGRSQPGSDAEPAPPGLAGAEAELQLCSLPWGPGPPSHSHGPPPTPPQQGSLHLCPWEPLTSWLRRCYCFKCVDTLVAPGTSGRVQATSNWVCFLCRPFPRSGLLQRRRKWRGWLKAFCDRESETPLETYETVPVWKREPVRVLSLFGDIRTELVSLGFLEGGSNPAGLKHLDDVTDVVRRDVEGWGPFNLVYGSTPALGHACDHPPAWYLFQYHRVLQYARPRPGCPKPFFWMFVDNLVLTREEQTVATRFLEADPVTIQDVCGQAVRDAVHVWSNIPAVKSPGAPASHLRAAFCSQDTCTLCPRAPEDTAFPPYPTPCGACPRVEPAWPGSELSLLLRTAAGTQPWPPERNCPCWRTTGRGQSRPSRAQPSW